MAAGIHTARIARVDQSHTHLQQGRLEAWRLLEVLQQPSRGGDKDVHADHRRLLLSELLLAPRD